MEEKRIPAPEMDMPENLRAVAREAKIYHLLGTEQETSQDMK